MRVRLGCVYPTVVDLRSIFSSPWRVFHKFLSIFDNSRYSQPTLNPIIKKKLYLYIAFKLWPDLSFICDFLFSEITSTS